MIELHFREVGRLFDSLDPSPLQERDINRQVEEYIVDSAADIPRRVPMTLVIYIDEPADVPELDRKIAAAVRLHFAGQAQSLRRALRRLLRRGLVSLLIGLGVLVAFFLTSRAVAQSVREPGPLVTLLRESLVIGGWVAMWKPLETFLYDWWPIVIDRRIRDRLTTIEVRAIASHKHP